VSGRRDHPPHGGSSGDGSADAAGEGARGARAGRPADPAAQWMAMLVADLRQRLRPVCHDWDDQEFEALVRRIARIKARWAGVPPTS
jgi:hypothetical protein